jgi:L-cysteine:1D-myo-inositol 2-amino-2-deoxy-alpha-D-glucopyranoside ligase
VGRAVSFANVKLYDRPTGGLREVEILPRMGVYVCGITPYDSAHLGHAFTYVHFDVLVRYLRHLGAEVNHVQNLTDVDDDILRVSKERGEDFRDLAERENAAFTAQMKAIGVEPPTHNPRATAFVPQMVEEVRRLRASGRAYERDGTVYFRVGSDPRYGRLSGYDRTTMLTLSAERGGHPEDPAKDDPLDFVLWQRSLPGEPSWDSPWGPGRPGWHIECSTMARSLLDQPVDVHGGGSDLFFPHHESELAQAEGVTGGRRFVRHWVHTGAVHQGDDKMSKSLGNMTFVQDLLDRYPARTVREYLLGKHYRRDWLFDPAELDLEATAAPAPEGQPTPTRERFLRALDEDLDTPGALRLLKLARLRAEDDPSAAGWVEEGEDILGLSAL